MKYLKNRYIKLSLCSPPTHTAVKNAEISHVCPWDIVLGICYKTKLSHFLILIVLLIQIFRILTPSFCISPITNTF